MDAENAGKTAVFISIILLLCVTAGCDIAAIFMAASDFYEKLEKVLIRDFLDRRVEQDAFLLTQEALYIPSSTPCIPLGF